MCVTRESQNPPVTRLTGFWPWCRCLDLFIPGVWSCFIFSSTHFIPFSFSPDVFRSLANNNLKSLPKGLFSDLNSLIELWVLRFRSSPETLPLDLLSPHRFYLFLAYRDLRGNQFHCVCQSMWLMLWVKKTNATVSEVFCAEPEETKGISLKDFPEKHAKCASTGNCVSNLCTVQHYTVCIQYIYIYTYIKCIYSAVINTSSRPAHTCSYPVRYCTHIV